MTDYKVGDFVYCDFDLVEVKEVDGGRVREVTDGYFRKGSTK